MSEDQTLEHVQAHDYISFVSQDIADELANQGLEEIRKAKEVGFNPVDDAKKLQAVIDYAAKKIEELSNISVEQFLEQESQVEAQLKRENTTEPIILQNEKPGLASRIAGEYGIAKTMNLYAKLMASTMKEKRLLAGQLYGSRMAHNSQVGRMRSVKSVKLTGKDLLDEFASRTQTLDPKEDVPQIESASIRRIAPPVQTTNILNGTFTPVEDSKESEEEFDMLCEDFED